MRETQTRVDRARLRCPAQYGRQSQGLKLSRATPADGDVRTLDGPSHLARGRARQGLTAAPTRYAYPDRVFVPAASPAVPTRCPQLGQFQQQTISVDQRYNRSSNPKSYTILLVRSVP
jgi:hypothetical protein